MNAHAEANEQFLSTLAEIASDLRARVFSIAHEPGGPEVERVPFGEMLAANAEDDFLCAWLRDAEIGALLKVGGGAAAYSEIRRVG